MKLKLILCLLGVFSLLKVNAALGIGNDEISEKVLIEMKGNDVPFDILTNGDLGDHRSVQPLIPIFVMLDGSNNTLDLYFEQAIGEVDITISQNRKTDFLYSFQSLLYCVDRFLCAGNYRDFSFPHCVFRLRFISHSGNYFCGSPP